MNTISHFLPQRNDANGAPSILEICRQLDTPINIHSTPQTDDEHTEQCHNDTHLNPRPGHQVPTDDHLCHENKNK